MNNEQFRRLVLDRDKHSTQNGTASTGTDSRELQGGRKFVLGSMMPRNVQRSSNHDYARQMAERKAGDNKAKARGPKLAKGYQGRAQQRLEDEDEEQEEDEKVTRLKALYQQVKEGKLTSEEFDRLREEIAGGDVKSTHLVKGLDRRLLERTRRGEDVLSADSKAQTQDVDDEFDDLESKEVHTVQKEAKAKQGEKATGTLPVAGTKRSRDDILKELKAQRQAQAASARPELGDKFKAIETNKPKITIDKKGREVIITRDEHGNIKKKVRKVPVAGAPEPVPAAAPPPLESELPAQVRQEIASLPAAEPETTTMTAQPESDAESDVGAMFDDAGSDYDPFKGMDDDDSEGEKDNTEAATATKPATANEGGLSGSANAPAGKRNYFGDAAPEPEDKQPTQNPFVDPSFLSAISRASDIARARDEPPEDPAEKEKQARLAAKREAMLASSNRDMDDMDLGFGGGRFDDDDDDEGDGGRIKLSEWGKDDDDEGGASRGGGGKRKRTKKRKGDKNDAKDVLEVMRRQQKQ